MRVLQVYRWHRRVILILGIICWQSANSDTYFDWLVAAPEHYSSTDLRSQAEVVANLNFSDKSKATTEYDSVMDAAKFTIKPGKGSVEIGDQIRHHFPYVDTGNIFFYWESLAPSYWARDGGVDGVNTYKTFQLSRDGSLTLEFRYRFSQVDRPYVARVDTRVYGAKEGVQIGPQDSAAPQTGEFNILPDKWVRFWVHVDYDNNRLSYWVGDQDREAVTILDAVHFDWEANYGSRFGLDQFWFEFNTSQKRSPDPTAYMYGRNLAVLRNVADPKSLVAGYQVVRPKPPDELN